MSLPTPPHPPLPPLLTTAATLAAGTLAVSLPLATFNGTLFSLHPSLLALAWAGLAWRGTLAALVGARPADGDARVGALWAHAAWQGGAVALGAGGVWAVYVNKNRLAKPHFTTLHAKLGLAALICSLAAPLLGALSFRAIGLLHHLPPHTHAPLKRAHRVAGAAALAFSATAAFIGVGHPAVASAWLTPVWRAAIATLAGVGVAAAHAPTAAALESGLVRGLQVVGLDVASPEKAF